MRLNRIATIAVLLLLLAGCAPQRIGMPDLSVTPRRARYEAALERRADRVAADVELSAWVIGSSLPELPGVSARLVLVAPDAFRLRVGSLFGTALEASARGDSFVAYVPSRRMVLETRTAHDSLGLGDPGGLGYRVWSAAWRPPAQAWDRAVWQDSLLVLRWIEDADSVRMAIGSNGHPHWVEMSRDSRPGVRADYTGWNAFDGVMWPSQFVIEDGRGAYGLRCRVQSVQFRRTAERSRLSVSVPDDAERVTRDDLKRAIERLGKL